MLQEQSLLNWTQSLFIVGQSLAADCSEAARQQLLEHIVTGFGAASGSIALMSDDRTNLVLVAGTGSAANFIGSATPVGAGVMGWVVQHKQPLLLAGDISKDPRFSGLKMRGNPSRPVSALCWPLLVEGRVIGTVSINRDASSPNFTERDLTDGQTMIGLVSLVVDNMRLSDQQRQRIDDLKRETAARAASETRLSAILDIAPTAVIVANGGHAIQVFNKAAEQIFGYGVEEMLGQPVHRLLPQQHAGTHGQQMQIFSAAEHTQQEMGERREVHGVRKNGELFPAAVAISRVVVDGQVHFIAMLRDLSKQKAMEKALADSAQALATALLERQNIMDALQDIIFHLDQDARLVSWNRRVETVTNYSSEELSGRSAFELLAAEDHEAVRNSIQETMEQGASEVEAYLICKNGNRVRYHWVSGVLRDEQGRVIGISGTGRDVTIAKELEAALRKEKEEQAELITKLKEAQGQLLQSEKLASIGQLAAGVAHEINNPVGYVSSNLATLQKYAVDLLGVIAMYEKIEAQATEEGAFVEVRALKQQLDIAFLRDDTVSLIHESLEGLGRVKKIVQDLKDFSHVDHAEWQWTNLHKGIDSTLNIVHNELKYKATVVKEYGTLPDVECIASQVNQVFMNMLVNGAHAIETRGTITIRTGVENDQVWVEFADTGKGIPQENLKRIFDPFFTTKPVGKGTGLGLSLAYGIVEKHRGRIEVESEVGKGTRFRIHLPVRQAEKQAGV